MIPLAEEEVDEEQYPAAFNGEHGAFEIRGGY
jgi:hypothetical protein